MDIIATKTQYVTGTSSEGGDPSPYTASGICLGIEAAVKFKLNKDHLKGIRVAVQGMGHVGYALCKELISKGAIVTACDVDQSRIEKYVKEFHIEVVSPENIYDVECDVFAPCALGGTLNETSIARLTTAIVAGAANNQLQKPEYGEMLHLRGILYAPDYVINAGGLIFAYAQYTHAALSEVQDRIRDIYDTLTAIFKRSQTENYPASLIADKIAAERLADEV
jgi:leucine dehydrogenase